MQIFWPANFILNDSDIKLITSIHPDSLTSPTSVTQILEKSMEWDEEWAEAVHSVIIKFDTMLKTQPKVRVPTKRKHQPRNVKSQKRQNAVNYQEAEEDEDGASTDAEEIALRNICARCR